MAEIHDISATIALNFKISRLVLRCFEQALSLQVLANVLEKPRGDMLAVIGLEYVWRVIGQDPMCLERIVLILWCNNYQRNSTDKGRTRLILLRGAFCTERCQDFCQNVKGIKLQWSRCAVYSHKFCYAGDGLRVFRHK